MTRRHTSGRRARTLRRCTAAVVAAALLLAASSYGAAAIHFTPESLTVFYKQLANGQVHAVTFNKLPHSIHISMNDGQHFIASYDPTKFAGLSARIQAAGVPVLIEHPHPKTGPVHHRLRYVAAAVLVVLIVVIAVVLALNRRRNQADAEAAAAQPAAAAPPPPPPPDV